MTTGQGDIVAFILEQDVVADELLKGPKTPVNIEGLLAYIQNNSSGGVVVPGSYTELLLNDSGALGAASVLTWDGTTFKADAPVVINESGADVDFRVEADTEANALFVQGSNGNVGIGTGTPTQALEIYSNVGGISRILIDADSAGGTAELFLREADGSSWGSLKIIGSSIGAGRTLTLGAGPNTREIIIDHSNNSQGTGKIRFHTGTKDDAFLIVREGYPVFPSYTVATLPSATTAAGMIYVTDEAGVVMARIGGA